MKVNLIYEFDLYEEQDAYNMVANNGKAWRTLEDLYEFVRALSRGKGGGEHQELLEAIHSQLDTETYDKLTTVLHDLLNPVYDFL